MEVHHSRENAIRFFESYTAENAGSLKGQTVIDLSAGTGYTASLFHKAGAQVTAFDLFPDQIQYPGIKGQYIDLQKDFPCASDHADVIILSETIECLPDQLHFFKEAARVLKPGGIFILTTPNPSSLRSRFAQFMMEGEHYSRSIPDETDAWVTWPGTSHQYLSKIFISGVLRLRTLAALNNLEINEIYKTQYTSTAILLLFTYPLLWFFSRKNMKRKTRNAPEHRMIYEDVFRINTSMKVLLSKHLIITFRKK